MTWGNKESYLILFDDCLNMYIQYLGYIHTLRHRLGIRFFIQRIIRKNAKSEKSISIPAYIKFCIKHIIPLSVVNLLRFHRRKFKEMPLLLPRVARVTTFLQCHSILVVSFLLLLFLIIIIIMVFDIKVCVYLSYLFT